MKTIEILDVSIPTNCFGENELQKLLILFNEKVQKEIKINKTFNSVPKRTIKYTDDNGIDRECVVPQGEYKFNMTWIIDNEGVGI